MALLYKVNSEGSTEPVTLSEAKNWCKVDSDLTEDDSLFADIIASSRQECEAYCERSFIDRNITIRVRPEDLVDDTIYLKMVANSVGLTVTKYYQGSSAVLSTDYYFLDEFENKLMLKYNKEWPDFDYMDITYDCINSTDERVKKCVLNLVYEDYEYRTNGKARNRAKIHYALDQLRIWMFK